MQARSLLSSWMMSLFLLWGARVEAQPVEPKGAGFALGFRAAYGIPVGRSVANVNVADEFGRTVSPQVELAYYFNTRLSLSAYFQLGFGRSPDSCFEALCGATVRRYGLEVDYRFRPGEFVSPWVGAGIGYEIASVSLEEELGDTESRSLERRGFDLGHANVGVDLRLNRTVALGPYLTTSLGRYRKTDSVDIPGDSRRFHVWIQPGVRMQLHF